ncbi:MAG: hypothetical protein HYT11_03805 [Candidatus Levybacteria bacterium]|nr:hypothetical protein [Candidatus Levybacteria bacterium]
MEQLFNLAFLTCFVGGVVGWFSGSIVGGVIAGSLFLLVVSKRSKLPVGRISDIFSVAFLCALPLGFSLYYLFHPQHEILYLLSAIFSLFLFLFFLLILLPKALRSDMKDGSLASLFFINITLLVIFTSVFQRVNKNLSFSFEDGMLAVIFVGACVLLIKQERKSLLRHIRR